VKKEKSMYLPDLSVGYFNQSIDHVRGLQGVSIGVSVPLLNRNHHSAIRKAEIQTEIQSNSYGKLENELTNRVESLRSILAQKGKLLEENDAKWSAKIEMLTQASEVELNEGEIDYTKYVQARGAILNLGIQRLQLIDDYNQTLLELNYYLSSN
jgi:cobalt-zinc-cadmium resistance protein CzcA